jgi:dTDP-glucose 4,6-dehydratase
MKILVTGGAGFIGSNFIRYWLSHHQDDQIVNLDKLTYAGNISSIKDFSTDKRHTFIKGDICNPKSVKKALVGVDYVVHFAAESHVDRSILDPGLFIRSNVVGTQILLSEAVEAKVKRFHLVSTDEVFGELTLDGGKFSESTPYNPRSPYAASKAAADHLARAFFNTYGLPITITNTANNYGSYQDTEKFIPRMITNLLTGGDILIYGDGKYVRDWLHVEDHSRAIDMVLHKGKPGDTYLVGGLMQDVNNLEIAKIILNVMDLPESKIRFVKDRPGHDRRYAIDWSKIENELGWNPQHTFEEWIKKTVVWYKENERWWKPLKEESEKLYMKTGQV